MHRASVGLLAALYGLTGAACFHPTASDDSSSTTATAFAEPLVYTIGSSAWRVTVGDYNGDDALDIAATTLNEVYLFLQDV